MKTPAPNDGLKSALIAAIGALVGITSTALWVWASTDSSPLFLVVALSALAGTGAAFVFYSVRTVRAHPRSLQIALIGPPAAGKTVFLTLLFDKLQIGEARGLMFAPYGRATTELVSRTLTLLANGKFPPRTSHEVYVTYQAVATYTGGFFPTRYRIQIADYAGEHLASLDPGDGHWLQDSDFFEYVVSSDALWIMVDCERLICRDRTDINVLENRLVAALHTLIEKRSDDPTSRLTIPVGLILSKSDVLSSLEETGSEIAYRSLARLIGVCRARCRFFEIFFVSSLGSTPEDPHVPPQRIEPEGILDPLLWILGRGTTGLNF